MELAVALAGAAIGVQPFDQPDVAAAKAATAEVLAEGGADVPEQPLADLLAQLEPGDHLALQAFVDPGDPRRRPASRPPASALRDRHRVATSLGLGPRFLHSTGQLHKGGPRAIVCVQVVERRPARDRRSPASPSASATSSRPRRPATCAPSRRGHPGRPRRPRRRCWRSAHVKLGMVGLGRMGGNMAERLRAHGHEVVGYDVFSDATDVATLEDAGRGAARPAARLGDGPGRRSHRGHREQPRRGCWRRATS